MKISEQGLLLSAVKLREDPQMHLMDAKSLLGLFFKVQMLYLCTPLWSEGDGDTTVLKQGSALLLQPENTYKDIPELYGKVPSNEAVKAFFFFF